MSFWSNNPELYDEIIFRQMVAEGLADEEDDPFETVHQFTKSPQFSAVAQRAEQEYWGSRIDEAMVRRKEQNP